MRFKNEVLVGLVVVAGLIIVAVGSFWLSGRPFARAERELVAVFEQVGQLRPGNPVTYRGVAVGRVTEIELAAEGTGVFVTMRVAPDLELPADLAVMLSTQSLFGDWQASLISQSMARDLEFVRVVGRPDVLPGTALPEISELTAVAARIAGDIETFSDRFALAFTDETALQVRQIVGNVQEMSEQLSGFVDQQAQTFDRVASNAVVAAENIRATTATVERIANEVDVTLREGEVQQILSNVRQASETLRAMSLRFEEATGGIPAMVARADTTFITVARLADDIGVTLRALEPTIAEVGPTIAEARIALATLQRAAARMENGDGTMGRLMEDPALYEETQAAIASLRRLMADVQANPTRYLRNVKVGVF